jgi:hypothetical protein
MEEVHNRAIGAGMQTGQSNQGEDLTAALARARAPVRVHPRPGASPMMRLRTRPATYRLIPPALTLARAERRGLANWRARSEAYRAALAATEAVVAGTELAGEVDQLTRRRLIESEIHEALYWRPWTPPAIDSASRANLLDAIATGRGVMLSCCHLGPFFLGAAGICSLGVELYSTTGPWLLEPPTAGYWGRRVDRWIREIAARGEHLISTTGAFDVVRVLLEEGRLVKLFFDMPGGTRTEFLGKPVMLASGSARLAWMTGALLVPMHLRRSGHGGVLRFGAPLDATAHESHESLHRALASIHERAILEDPSGLEDPNRPGGWEHRALPSGWTRSQDEAPAGPA